MLQTKEMIESGTKEKDFFWKKSYVENEIELIVMNTREVQEDGQINEKGLKKDIFWNGTFLAILQSYKKHFSDHSLERKNKS